MVQCGEREGRAPEGAAEGGAGEGGGAAEERERRGLSTRRDTHRRRASSHPGGRASLLGRRRQVTLEERDRSELIFASDFRPSPGYIHEQRVSATKVPLKLTSMNFEMNYKRKCNQPLAKEEKRPSKDCV